MKNTLLMFMKVVETNISLKQLYVRDNLNLIFFFGDRGTWNRWVSDYWRSNTWRESSWLRVSSERNHSLYVSGKKSFVEKSL